jgi:uncharacterized membrane protein
MTQYAYWLMFSLLAIVTLIFSILLAVNGYWVILPFTVLHLLFVWWGFYKAYQQSEIIQFITIKCDETIIGDSKVGQIQRFETPWVRLNLTKDKKNQQSTRLFLLAHDKMREIGLGIIDCERKELSLLLEDTLSIYRAY